MPEWEAVNGNVRDYCKIEGGSVVVGRHGSSGHSDSAGGCSRKEFLDGRFHQLILERVGEHVLYKVLDALGGDRRAASKAVEVWKQRNRPAEPARRPVVPAGVVSKMRASLEEHEWTQQQYERRIPHLDKLAPNRERMAGCTELTHALQFADDYEQWQWLEHLDVNEVDANGCSPLNMAILHSYRGVVVQRLVDAGAEVNSADGNGVLPIEVAMAEATKEQFKVLKKARIDVARQLDGGRTYLHLAVERRCTRSFSELKKLKVDIDAVDDEGRTALHYGIFNGCAVDLMKLRMNPDVEDAYGDSPLAVAATGALSHRLAEFHAEGSARGKPAVFTIEDNMLKVQVGKRKPRKLPWKNERKLAREYCPEHDRFLTFVEACVWMCKRADLELPTRWGVPVGQLVADLRRPEVTKIVDKRGVALPPPRANVPHYERPTSPPTVAV